MGRRTDIDWGAIRADVSIGAISLRQIAKKHGIAESNLRAKVVREAWPRGNGEAVRAAAQKALAATAEARAREIGAEIGAEQVRLYEARLKDVALSAVEVAQEHQATARRGMGVANDLLTELQAACALKDLMAIEADRCRGNDAARAAAIDKLLGVRARIETLDRWASGFSKLVAAEREARGMDADDQRSSLDELLLKIAADKRSQ